MVDQNTALWLFAFLSLSYIFYTEWLSAIVSRYFSPLKVTLSYNEGVQSVTAIKDLAKAIENSRGGNHPVEYAKHTVAIDVFNSSRKSVSGVIAKATGQTLKGNSADEVLLPSVTGKYEPITLNPKEKQRFYVGTAKPQSGEHFAGFDVGETSNIKHGKGMVRAWGFSGDYYCEVSVSATDCNPVKLYLVISKDDDNKVTCESLSYLKFRARYEEHCIKHQSKPLVANNP